MSEKENLDEFPAIKSLNLFADKLQPEHRGEFYKHIESFLRIGVMHGVYAGIMGSHDGKSAKGDRSDEYASYFQKKADENSLKG